MKPISKILLSLHCALDNLFQKKVEKQVIKVTTIYCCRRFLFRAIYAFLRLAVSSIVQCSLKILIPLVNKIKASHLSKGIGQKY